MRKFFGYFIDQSLFVNLLSFLVILVGIITVLDMPKEIFPNVDFDIVTVSTPYPGAAPLEVENLVTTVIEEQLREVTGIKDVFGTSIENISYITLILEPRVKNKKKVIGDIKSAVERSVPELPAGTEQPLVNEMVSGDQPIIELAVYGDVPYSDLRESAKRIKKALEKVPGVSKIGKVAYQDAEIWIQADPRKLETHHVSLNELIQVVQQNNISSPGGKLKQDGTDTLIRTSEQVRSPEELEALVVRKSYDGRPIRIKDVATVQPAFKEADILTRGNGEDAVRLVVIKRENVDAIRVVDKLKETLQNTEGLLLPGVKTSWINDFSYYVKRRLNVLTANGLFGVILIMIVLFLLMHPFVAFWTAVGIPFAFGLGMIVCQLLGINIHLISMIGMLIVLGMLVDDAIVVGENIFSYIERGVKPREAAERGLTDVVVPVSSTITTTIVAFFPLMFMSGIMGKFIWSIPVVVIACLCASWLESFFILPNHLSSLVPKRIIKRIQENRKRGSHKAAEHWLATPIRKKYFRVLATAIRNRYAVVLAFFALLGLSIFALVKGYVPFVLFETKGMDTFFVRVKENKNASLETTRASLMQVEEILMEELRPDEKDFLITTVGQTEQGMNDANRVRSSHVGQIMVKLVQENDRERTVEEILQAAKDRVSRTHPELLSKLNFDPIKPGPPTGKALYVRIKGENLDTLEQMATKVMNLAADIPGVRDLDHSLQEGKEEWRVKVDKNKAADLKVSIPQVAITIQAAFDGFPASTIRSVDEAIDIRIRLLPEYRIPDEKIIRALQVPNQEGRLIPLASLITLEKTHSYLSVLHHDFERYVSVTGDVDNKLTTPLKVSAELDKRIKPLIQDYPTYSFETGGEVEDTRESMRDLFRMFFVALGLVFLILASTFRSVTQPLIIMSCIPFALAGVVFAFFFHDRAVGFLAMVGIVGLVGVEVNDSIVYMDFVNKHIQRGKGLYRALLEAGSQRIRPILMTSITTVFGVLPTAYGIGGFDPFLVPLALSIAWGLAFGTFVTLFYMPCQYAILYDIQQSVKARLPFFRNNRNNDNLHGRV
jgi:multidrug efflux pump subunit AcrB